MTKKPPLNFDAFAGRRAKLELDRLVEGNSIHVGRILNIEDGNILIAPDDGSAECLFPSDWIVRAELLDSSGASA